MKFQIYCPFLFLILLNSCLKDDDQNPIFAGVYDSNFIYHEYNPPLSVQLMLDSITNYYSGTDSIDINLDGNYDVIISQHLQIPNLTNSPTNQLYPYCRLTPKNRVEVAVNKQMYPAGFGTYETVNWIDSLYFKARIDEISGWAETSKFKYMWCIPPSSFVNYNGFWYNVIDPELYIGIRMKIDSDYKYGWIKVDATSRENMRFMSYAIEK